MSSADTKLCCVEHSVVIGFHANHTRRPGVKRVSSLVIPALLAGSLPYLLSGKTVFLGRGVVFWLTVHSLNPQSCGAVAQSEVPAVAAQW